MSNSNAQRQTTEIPATITRRFVWDRPTRWFHWLNLIFVIALAGLGLFILNAKAFGVSGDGKILLKTLHVYVGYCFVLNIAWRLIWGFVGNRFARWSFILPVKKGYVTGLRGYLNGLSADSAPTYLGHNPLGRLMIMLLLLLLCTQSLTGLVIAGTDLYKPPFGGMIAAWVTGGDPEMRAELVPGSKDHVDPAAYDEMRRLRKPIVTTHLYVFYALMAASVLHIAGVVVAEVRDRNGLVSAMITGQKVFDKTPADDELPDA